MLAFEYEIEQRLTATRYKNFVFLTLKSSEEVVKAFKGIYDNSDNSLNWLQKMQCDKSTEFMRYVTLLMNKHGVEIQRIIAYFRYTSLAIIDRYAELFKLRVFKNQYSIEFLLLTDKHYREYERFARKIVDNMNDSST